jgi:hypothetical protein
MLMPDLAWMQNTGLSIAAVAAVLSLTNVLLGLFSVVTGKDHLPLRIRHLLWKMPASADDHRTHGMSLMLNGAAIMLVELGLTAGIFGSHGVRGFPADVMFFVTMLAFCASLALTVGAYSLGVRTRYVSTRTSTDTRPAIPPT